MIETGNFVYQSNNGHIEIKSFDVFSGISLEYIDADVAFMDLKDSKAGNAIEIIYCMQGSIRLSCENVVLDTFEEVGVTERFEMGRRYELPTKLFRGICLKINTEFVSGSLAASFNGMDIRPVDIAANFKSGVNYLTFSQKKRIVAAFSELYNLPKEHTFDYIKVKLVELFLILNSVDECDCHCSKRGVSDSQQVLAEAATGFIRRYIHEKISVDDIANHLSVSKSYIQKIFKNVYGMPVYSYMKNLRMKHAALELTSTDKSVLDIAADYGYENASKFSASFCRVMGVTPFEYRKQKCFEKFF